MQNIYMCIYIYIYREREKKKHLYIRPIRTLYHHPTDCGLTWGSSTKPRLQAASLNEAGHDAAPTVPVHQFGIAAHAAFVAFGWLGGGPQTRVGCTLW